MSGPSLAEALDAYAHAIACGADSITLAERFADLRGAHRARTAELHEAEEAVARVWDRLLPELEVDA